MPLVVENKLLDALIGSYDESNGREQWRRMLRNLELEANLVDIEVPQPSSQGAAGATASGNPNIIQVQGVWESPPDINDLLKMIQSARALLDKRVKRK